MCEAHQRMARKTTRGWHARASEHACGAPTSEHACECSEGDAGKGNGCTTERGGARARECTEVPLRMTRGSVTRGSIKVCSGEPGPGALARAREAEGQKGASKNGHVMVYKQFSGGVASEPETEYSVHEDLDRHYQRKLAGYVQSMILTAQDFVELFCSEDERGFFTEAAKKQMARINDSKRSAAAVGGNLRQDQHTQKAEGDSQHDR